MNTGRPPARLRARSGALPARRHQCDHRRQPAKSVTRRRRKRATTDDRRPRCHRRCLSRPSVSHSPSRRIAEHSRRRAHLIMLIRTGVTAHCRQQRNAHAAPRRALHSAYSINLSQPASFLPPFPRRLSVQSYLLCGHP